MRRTSGPQRGRGHEWTQEAGYTFNKEEVRELVTMAGRDAGGEGGKDAGGEEGRYAGGTEGRDTGGERGRNAGERK